jgi:hypothetical protein
MAPATSRYSSIVELILILLIVLPLSQALKFDLVAHSGHSTKNERCVRNFVNKDTLVVVTAIISGSRGDGQVVNMHVSGVYVAIPQVLLQKQNERNADRPCHADQRCNGQ